MVVAIILFLSIVFFFYYVCVYVFVLVKAEIEISRQSIGAALATMNENIIKLGSFSTSLKNSIPPLTSRYQWENVLKHNGLVSIVINYCLYLLIMM